MRRNILSVMAIVLLALSFTSCKKEQIGTGYIQFTNASELSSPVDFYVSDIKKNSNALAYTQSTGYFALSAKKQPANVKVSLTGTSVFNFDVTPADATYYSVFYISEGTAVAYPDAFSAPATGKARVRFINLNMAAAISNDFGISGGAKLVSALEAKLPSDYYDVAPGATFAAYVTGTTTVLLNIPTTIEAGHIYTIYLSGKNDAGLKANVLLQK
ncbi:DUF4397 domain-containing protein [Mucilaginibacter antarcticus]|uniref:DUF4397 domain-containing protein n=1 Tax=Mucilaginibacter antarcticus TaxID=1855725 RepID=A0ABW5XJI7_9SPHI